MALTTLNPPLGISDTVKGPSGAAAPMSSPKPVGATSLTDSSIIVSTTAAGVSVVNSPS